MISGCWNRFCLPPLLGPRVESLFGLHLFLSQSKLRFVPHERTFRWRTILPHDDVSLQYGTLAGLEEPF